MGKPSFVVTVSVNGVSNSSVWDAEKPFGIGHPFRWVLEKTSGGVRVRNLAASGSAAIREIADGAIRAKGVSVGLPESDARSPFSLDIRPVISLPPAIETHDGAGGEWRVYAYRGDWTLESIALEHRYDGMIEGRQAFRIQRKSDELIVKSRIDGLRCGERRLDRGERITLRARELRGCTLSAGEFQWRIGSLSRPAALPQRERTPLFAGEEGALFKKSLQGAVAALAIFALLAFLWPAPRAQTVIAPQFTKLIFKKPVRAYMTAAASGYADETSYGKTQSGKPRGSSMKRVAKAFQHKAPGPQAAVARRIHEKRENARGAGKQVARTESRQPRKVAIAKTSPRAARSARAGHDLRAVTGAPSDQGFRKAERGLVRGGISNLLADSRFASGRDARAEAKGLFGSRSGSHGGSFASSDSLGSRQVEVASLGGDGGLFGGNAGVGYGRGSHARVSGQGRSFVSVDPGASDVDEGLTKEQVGEVIHRHMSEIRYCYEAAQLRVPDLQGRLAVAFVIGGAGGVNTARVSQKSSGEGQLGDCLVSRLRNWKFPHPRGGVNVAVNYPFIFKTLGR